MQILPPSAPTPLQQLSHSILDEAGVTLFVKRDDLIHPTITGNKYRKLKYNLEAAKEQGHHTILTFGGSYSNHLYATAAAGKMLGFRTIAIVRGEEFEVKDMPTLAFCREQGMELHFVSREEYRQRHSLAYLYELIRRLGKAFVIPEGGTSSLALKGVAEMADEVAQQLGTRPDFFAVSAGTGGTAAGLLATGSNVLAFPALKGANFLRQDISDLLVNYPQPGNLQLITDYHFGGYAKWNAELADFIESFRTDFNIQLEQVYTAKMFYGLFDQIKKNRFESGTTIVAIHTGGLQGLFSS